MDTDNFYEVGVIYDKLSDGVMPHYSVHSKSSCYVLTYNQGALGFIKIKGGQDEREAITIPTFFRSNFEDLKSQEKLDKLANFLVAQVNASTGGSLRNKKISVICSLYDHRNLKVSTTATPYEMRKLQKYYGQGLEVGMMLIVKPLPTGEEISKEDIEPRKITISFNK